MKVLVKLRIILITITLTTVFGADQQCLEKNDNGFTKQIPHPNDCRKFYKCDQLNNLQIEKCEHNLEYNPFLQICDWPRGFCMPWSNNPVQNVFNCSQIDDGSIIPNYENNCKSYFYCYQGITRIGICENNETFDHILSLSCSNRTDITCEKSDYLSKIPKNVFEKRQSHLKYPNMKNVCKSYFHCTDNICNEIFCPKNYIYDVKTEQCEVNNNNIFCEDLYFNRRSMSQPKSSVHCNNVENGKWFDDIADKTKFFVCLNNVLLHEQCHSGQIFDNISGTCILDKNIAVKTCKGKNDNTRIIDSKFCWRYYECHNEKSYSKACPNNMMFNHITMECVQENASCRQNINGNCIQGQYKVDVNDCTKFLLCINDNWVNKACKNGQYFNQQKNYCIANDGFCKGCVDGSYKPDPNNCVKFLLCVKGKWRKQACPPKQYFNTMKGYCILDDGTCPDVTPIPTEQPFCTHGEFKSNDKNCREFFLCVLGKWRNQVCPKGQYFNVEKNYCTVDDGSCEHNTLCTDGKFQPDSKHCAHFQLCVLGKWRHQRCPNGQYFNVAKNYCIPNDGTCKDIITTTTSHTTTPITTTTTIKVCEDGEFRPDPKNCAQFEVCVFGKWRRQRCPDGLYFNKAKSYCILHDGTCKDVITTTTSHTTTPITTTTTIKVCEDGDFRPDPKNCAQFAVCVLGQWRRQRCPDGQYFNVAKNYCILHDGTCNDVITTTTPITTTTAIKVCEDGEFRPDYINCAEFELCVLGKWRRQRCPNGQYFNVAENYCILDDGTCNDVITTTTSITTTTAIKVCEDGEFRPDYINCAEFELCVLGKWRRQRCPDGQYFNVAKNYCILDDGTCNDVITTTTPITTTTAIKVCEDGEFRPVYINCAEFELCVLGKWRRQRCPDGQYFNVAQNYCIPDDGTCNQVITTTTPKPTTTTTKICEDGQFRPNPKNCVEFELCVFGKWRHQRCPDGQYFNVVENYCIPDDGTCNDVITTTTPKPTTPTTTTAIPTTTPKPTIPTTTPKPTIPTTTTTLTKICEDGQFRPNPKNCAEFELCVFGKWRHQRCPDGQYFNEVQNYCILDDGTCNNVITTTTPIPTTTTTKICEDGQFRPNRKNCAEFELCVFGKWRHQRCPDGQYFNVAQNYCIPDDGTCNDVITTTTPKPTTPTTTTAIPTTTSKPTIPTTTPKPTIPTTTTTLTKICEDGQFRPNPKNCAEFELCVFGKWRHQRCPDGQYFNEAQNYCIPDDGTCNSVITTTTPTPTTTGTKICDDGQFRPNPKNCVEFELCVFGKWRHQRCPDGQYFNLAQNYCIPDDGTCNDVITTTTPKPTTPTTTTAIPTTTPKPTIPTTTPKPTITTTTTTTTLTKICEDGQFRPNPKNCAEFELCVFGKWRHQRCPDGQYFNQAQNYCILDDGTCNDVITTTTPKPTTPTTTGTKICEDGEFRPNPNNCVEFELCVFGKWRHQRCPDGQYFNVAQNYCIPDDGTCNDVITTTTPKPTTPTTTTAIPTTTPKPTIPTTTPKPTIPTTTTTLTKICEDGQFRPNPKNCAEFELCVFGKWRHQRCPDGQYFNEAQNYCIPDDGTCNSVITTTTPTPTTTGTKICEDGQFRPNPKNCVEFELCVFGKWRHQRCPDGQYFNVAENYCIPDDGTCNDVITTTTPKPTTPTTTTAIPTTTPKPTIPTTTPKPTIPTTTTTLTKICEDGQFRPNPKNCAEFELCVFGKWRHQRCPDGQYFNEAQNYCIPDDGTCNSVITTTTPTPTTTGTKICDEGQFRPNPKNCVEFELCVFGKWRHQRCPDGQYFNLAQNYCIPDDGTCNDVITTTTPKPTTPTTTTAIPTTTPKPTIPTTTPKPTIPTTTTTLTKICEDGQFRPNPKNCAEFELCVFGKWRHQRCPDGQYFNQAQNYCILDDGTCNDVITTTTPTPTTTGTKICEDGQFRPNPKNCVEFELCVFGKWRHQRCPDGQYFNVAQNYCIPDDGTCNDVITTTTPKPTTPTTTTAIPTTTPKPTIPTTTPKPTIPTTTTTLTKICEDGQFRPNPKNCAEFELCVFGKWRHQRCPDGQYFNEVQNYCILDDGTCNDVITTTTPKPTTSTTTGTKICEDGQFRPNPNNCVEFDLCVFGKWRHQRCPDGQYFNVAQNYCIPDDGTCNDVITTTTPKPTTPTTTTAIPTTTPKPTTSTTTPKPTITTTTTTLTKICEDGQFRPNPKNCAEFELCVFGKWRHQRCPDGQYFNVAQNYCIPDDGTCNDVITTTTPKPTTTTTKICEDGQFRPNLKNCAEFELCVFGKWRHQRCPDGQYFNVAENYCIPDDGTCNDVITTTTPKPTTPTTTTAIPSTTPKPTIPTTTPKPTIPTTTTTLTKICEDGEFRPNHKNCAEFELCVFGKWRHQRCPDGQYFNEVQNYCILDDGTCNDVITTTTPKPTTTGTKICEDGEFRPNLKNCAEFELCVFGKWRHQRCPDGQYFNEAQNYCIPDDGTCNDVITTTTPKPTTSAIPTTTPKPTIPTTTPKPTIPTTTTTLTKICEDGQFRPNPKNCAEFELCVFGKWRHQRCPDGQYFNEVQNYCILDDGTCNDVITTTPPTPTTTGTKICEDGQFRPNYKNCAEFELCVFGKWRHQRCPDGQYFNEAQNYCIPDDGTCNDVITTTTPKPTTSAIPTTTPKPTIPTTTPKPTIPTTTTTLTKICEDGQFRPNPKNCAEFELCVFGKWRHQRCPDGQYFNEVQNYCILDDGTCNDVITTTPPTPTTTGTKICEDGQFRPNYKNCAEFELCVFGKWRHQRCPDGQYFNVAQNYCIPDDGTCNDVITTTTPKPTTPTTTTAIPTTTPKPTIPTTTPKPTIPTTTTTLTKICEDGEFRPNHKNCAEFELCVFGKWRHQRCPDGQYFNEVQNYCILDDGTCNDVITTTTPKPTTTGTKICEDGEFRPNLKNCAEFELCVFGKWRHQRCPDGQYFNEAQNYCIPDDGTCNDVITTTTPKPTTTAIPTTTPKPTIPTTTPKPTIPTTTTTLTKICEDGQFRPNPKNCAEFELCVFGKWRHQRCPDGQYFNEVQNYCILDDGTCNDVITTTTPKPTTTGTKICEDGEFRPNLKNCAEFELCVFGKWRHQRCPDGQYFNVAQNYCIPDDGTCNDVITTTTPKPTTPTTTTAIPTTTPKPTIPTTTPKPTIPTTTTTLTKICEDGEFRPNHKNCAEFELCVFGKWRHQRCPDGQYFNEVQNYCILDDGTCNDVITTTTPKPTTTGTKICEDGEFRPNLKNCAEFELCVFGKWRHQRCPDGQYFNEAQNYCIPDDGTCNDVITTTTPKPTTTAIPTTTPKPTIPTTTPKPTIPTTTTTLTKICEDGQFRPNPKNCAEFELCVFGKWRHQRCPDGQYFNEVQNYCILDDGTCNDVITTTAPTPTTTGTKICEDGQFRPNYKNCAEFELCVFGKWRHQRCPDGQYFNEAQNYCIPDDGTCNDVITTTTPKPTTTAIPTTTPKPTIPTTTPKPTIPTTTPKPTIPTTTTTLTKICEDGQFRPNPKNCAEFELCVFGKWRHQRCPDGQYFNEVQNYCILDDGTCNDVITTTTPTPTTTGTKICEDGQFRPNLKNCAEFELCVFGKWRHQRCPDGQYFNVAQNYCIPDDGTCNDVITTTTPKPTTPTTTAIPTTTPKPTITTTTPKPTIPTTTTTLTKICEDGQFRPNPKNCAEFELCVFGKWRHQRCPDGQYFNQAQNYCILDDGTCNEVITTTTPKPTTTTTKICEDGQFRPNPNNCVEFELCVFGKWRHQRCPDGQYFNVAQNYCIPDDGTCNDVITTTTPKPTTPTTTTAIPTTTPKPTIPTTTPKPTIPTTTTTLTKICEDGQFRPNPKNCAEFELCVFGKWRHQRCPDGQYFNEVQNYCILDDGTCNDVITTTAPTPTTTGTKICEDGQFRPNYKNCAEFELCVFGKWRHQRCPDGQYFNEAQNYCIPDDGTCNDVITTTTPKPTTTAIPTTTPKPTIPTTTPKPTIPTTTTTLTKICEDGQFRPNSKNCAEFELCVFGKWRHQRCPDGQYFNEVQNYCILDDGTCNDVITTTTPTPTTTGTKICEDGQFRPNLKNCAEFELCVFGKWRHQRCPDGQYFNVAQNYCIPDDGTCNDVITTTTPKPTTPTTTTIPTTTPKPTITTTTPKPTIPTTTTTLTKICEDGQFRPNPKNCAEFELCVFGKWRHQRCPDGQYFNVVENYCIPDDGTCNDVITTTTPKPTTTTTKICEDGQFRPNLKNCAEFELCVFGKWRHQRCPDGQYFNVAQNYCIPDDGTCNDVITTTTPKPTTPTTTAIPTTTPKPTITTTTPKPTIPTTTTTLTKICEDGQFRPNPKNCAEFELCVFGKWRHQRCPDGQYFNVVQNYCILDDGTCNEVITTTTPKPTTTTTKICEDGQFRPNLKNCVEFELCVFGKWRHQRCPDGQYFNVAQNYCIPDDGTCNDVITTTTPKPTTPTTTAIPTTTPKPTITTTTPKPTIPTTTTTLTKICEDGQFRPNPKNCAEFELCVFGKWRHQRCPDGQYFNEAQNYCILDDGTCNEVITTTTPKPTTTTTKICEDGQFRPNLKNCAEFELCVFGKWRHQRCPDGQYFNVVENYCIPDDGTCNDVITTTTPKSTTPTTTAIPTTTPKPTITTTTPKPTIPTTTTTLTKICEDGQFRPNPKNCAEFELCVFGKWRHQRCPDGQYFNEAQNYCILDDGTCNEVITTTTPKPTTTTTKICEDGQFRPNLKNCVEFELCVFGKWRHQRCPDGQYFNVAQNYCIPDDGTCNDVITTTTPKPTTPTTTAIPTTTPKPTITTTTPKPTIPTTTTTLTKICEDGQFRPNPKNCAEFELCVFGKWRHQRCPDGQYFNVVQNYCILDDGTCNEVITTTTPKPTTTTTKICEDGQFRPNPKNCAEFELCVFGKWRHQRCPDGQYFNVAQNYCIPDDGTCNDVITTTTPKPTTPTTTAIPTTTPKPTISTTTPKPTIPTPTTTLTKICEDGQFRPNPKNCAEFELCVFGKWRQQRCPDGQYFSEAKNYCIPDDGTCNQVITTTTPKPTTTTTKICEDGQFRPNPKNCVEFELCVFGKWRHQRCPDGQYFNVVENYCIPDDGTCNDVITTTTPKPTTPTTTTAIPTTTPKPTITTTTPKPTIPTPTTTLTKICEDGQFRPNPKNCAEFELCVFGKWRHQRCPDGQYFNVAENYCIPDDGTCNEVITTTTPKPTTTTTKICEDGQFRPNLKNCVEFELCVFGKWRHQRCPDGQYFNVAQNYCIPDDGTCNDVITTTTAKPTTPTTTAIPTTTPKPTISTTTPKPTVPTPTTTLTKICEDGQFRPNPKNCAEFELCVFGKWRHQRCPDGQYFSEAENYCIPDDGTCNEVITTTTPKPTTPTTTTTKICEDGQFRPNPKNCVEFELCVFGKWRHQRCPDGQYFNVVENYCIPDDGTCNDVITTTTPKPTTPTTTTAIPTTTPKPTITTTTPKPTIPTPTTTWTKICEDGQFRPNPKNCAEFELCVFGKWRHQRCPDGQYFSEAQNYCIPDDGTCNEVITTTTAKPTTPTTTTTKICEDGHFRPNPKNCVEFELCVFGKWRHQRCPDGQYFNVAQNYCIPDDGTCSDVITTTTPKPTTPTTTTIPTTTPKPTITTTTPKPTIPTPTTTWTKICEDGQFRPNPKNCAEFELCVFGQWRHQRCPDGQYFNEAQNYCIPDDGTCNEVITTTTAKPTTPTTTTTKICEDGQFRPNPKNCVEFELCVFGKWRHQRCPDGQYFNEVQNYCIPDDGTCKDVITTTTPEPTTPTATTTSAKICEDGQFQPDPKNCAEFVLCVFGKWRRQRCHDGQYFNEAQNYCVPDDGTCKDVIPTTTTKASIPTTTTTPIKICEDGQFRLYSKNCAEFELCIFGNWRHQRCPDGQYFNKAKNYCIPDDGSCPNVKPTQTTQTTTPTTPIRNCNDGEFRPDDSNCAEFKLCILGQWRQQRCPNGQYFNKAKNYCIPDDGSCANVKPIPTTETTALPMCKDGEFRPDYNNCAEFKLCVLGQWRQQRCQSGQYFNEAKNYCISDDGSCANVSPKPLCNDGEFLANSENCAQFKLCILGQWRQQHCPDGQYFNKAKHYCIPNDGSCDSGPKPICVDGEFRADSNNCAKFDICILKRWRNQECPAGKYFNKLYNYCVLDDGSCRYTKLQSTTPRCIDGSTYFDIDNCAGYYLCISGSYIQKYCPPYEYYNRKLRKCIPNDGSCENVITTSAPPNPTEKPNPPLSEISCYNQQHGTLLADPKDCTKFYVCVYRNAVQQQCHSGQFFDSKKKYCRLNDGSCMQNGIGKRSNSVNICTGLTLGTYLPHETDCSKFYICLNGHPIQQKCNIKEFFDPISRYCQRNNARCSSNNIINTGTKIPGTKVSNSNVELCAGFSETVFYPNIDDNCKSFYKCRDNIPEHQICPDGLLFNPTTQNCDWPESVKCSEFRKGIKDLKCIAIKDGLQYPNIKNGCKSYFVCVNGESKETYCNDNLIFNEVKSICDWPENVKC